MFSFAVFDSHKFELFLIRDAFGIKPLYFCRSAKNIYFSSEIKSLLTLSGKKSELNNQVIFEYINRGIIDHKEETFYKNIYQVKPAQFFKI